MSESSEQYDPPNLEVWGTVEEITATGQSSPAEDFRCGSVGETVDECDPPGTKPSNPGA
jgi:hypothetical protein